ncbi:anti-sigma factor, partial [Rhodopseudomonas sp. B29]|uniref:anti-sigma factor family protein n=1 Tax=Rhodopseudomonas sp. B29 TaxID=95607 RepID=UPI0004CF1DEF
LAAYVDGRLDDSRRAEVEAYLAANPEVAAQIDSDIADRDALRARLAPIAAEPIPARLSIPHLQASRRGSLTRTTGAIAAALACLLIGGGAGFGLAEHLYHTRPTALAAAPVADDAMLAWRTYAVEVAHPVEVAADQEDHLVKWLSKRLGRKLTAPKLDSLGLKLIGGRLLPSGAAPAAQFMYEDAQGRRVTVYVRPGGAGEPSAFRFEQTGNLAAFSWIDAKLSYAVVAQTNRDHLLGIARAIYDQYEAL